MFIISTQLGLGKLLFFFFFFFFFWGDVAAFAEILFILWIHLILIVLGLQSWDIFYQSFARLKDYSLISKQYLLFFFFFDNCVAWVFCPFRIGLYSVLAAENSLLSKCVGRKWRDNYSDFTVLVFFFLAKIFGNCLAWVFVDLKIGLFSFLAAERVLNLSW